MALGGGAFGEQLGYDKVMKGEAPRWMSALTGVGSEPSSSSAHCQGRIQVTDSLRLRRGPHRTGSRYQHLDLGPPASRLSAVHVCGLPGHPSLGQLVTGTQTDSNTPSLSLGFNNDSGKVTLLSLANSTPAFPGTCQALSPECCAGTSILFPPLLLFLHLSSLFLAQGRKLTFIKCPTFARHCAGYSPCSCI